MNGVSLALIDWRHYPEIEGVNKPLLTSLKRKKCTGDCRSQCHVLPHSMIKGILGSENKYIIFFLFLGKIYCKIMLDNKTTKFSRLKNMIV